jgi:hypothetical protein
MGGQHAKAVAKWEIREALRPQIERFWKQSPQVVTKLVEQPSVKDFYYREVEGIKFIALITEKLQLVAEIDVLLLRKSPRGSVVGNSGDLDNQLKTLIDALRVPSNKQEIPDSKRHVWKGREFHTLLEDDRLITRLNVECDQYLEDVRDDEVLAIVKASAKRSDLIVRRALHDRA